MTDAELCASLRMIHEWKIGKEAADRIEALVKERDEATNQLDSARHSVDVLEKRVEALVKEKEKMETEARAHNELWRAALRQKGQEKAAIEARADKLEAALKWQAEQPEAHPFMVARARTDLKGDDHV